jgi:hypothetical protein
MYKKKLVSKFFTCVCLIIPLIVVFAWFQSKQLLGTAEEGLPFYDSLRTFGLYKSAWVDVGFGFASPFYLPRITLYAFSSILELLKLQSWLIQAVIFYFLLITPLLSIPKLVDLFVSEKNKLYGYIAALFYVFNLFTLSQVFERFIYPLMFLWSYLPLFLYLWIRWVETKKIRYLLFLCVTSLVYSDAFGLTSSFLTLSISAVCFSIVAIFQSKEKIKKSLYSIFGYLIWFICQLWWIFPVWFLRNDQYLPLLSGSNSISSLTEVSKFFPSNEIFLLRQDYFFGPTNFLYHFYSQFPIFVLSIILLVFVILGIIVSLRNKKLYFIPILLFIGWFLSKGTNPPFGKEFYNILFTYLPFTQFLRNTYEKLGVIFLLPYSILFAIGLIWISDKFKSLKYVFLIAVLFICCGYLVKPIWSGTLFDNRIRVSIPSYYKDANVYLKNNNIKRILVLPLLQEPNIEYVWGYHGEDPSEFLFDVSSLSRSDSGTKSNSFYLNFPEYLNNKNFTNILALSSTDGIVVRRDTIRNSFNQETAGDLRIQVKEWKNIGKEKQFGELFVYTLSNNNRNPLIYPVNKIVIVKDFTELFNTAMQDSFDPLHSGILIYPQNKNLITPILSKNNSPRITFQKISSTKYLVHVNNSENSFCLIFSEAFNSLWQARIGNVLLSKHFEANGFSNGWIIDKVGTYDVKISFKVFPWD